MRALDTHAHIDVAVSKQELGRLDGCILAATRTPPEFERALARKDEKVVWGLGCHPAVADAHALFRQDRFSLLVQDAAVVSEIGLDRRSRVDKEEQRRTFETILEVVAKSRILSIHSAGMTSAVLDCLEKHQPVAAILHWWRGDRSETERALALGCYFSINAAEVASPRVMPMVPVDRVLTETDHPFGDRKEIAPRLPGRVETVEKAIAENWNLEVGEARQRMWRNFNVLVEATRSVELFSHEFQVGLLSVSD